MVLEIAYTADSVVTGEARKIFDKKGRMLESSIKNGNKIKKSKVTYRDSGTGLGTN